MVNIAIYDDEILICHALESIIAEHLEMNNIDGNIGIGVYNGK